MSDTAVSDFFQRFPMTKVSDASLDEVLGDDAAPVGILFLWG
jgi:hypothetical protein